MGNLMHLQRFLSLRHLKDCWTYWVPLLRNSLTSLQEVKSESLHNLGTQTGFKILGNGWAGQSHGFCQLSHMPCQRLIQLWYKCHGARWWRGTLPYPKPLPCLSGTAPRLYHWPLLAQRQLPCPDCQSPDYLDAQSNPAFSIWRTPPGSLKGIKNICIPSFWVCLVLVWPRGHCWVIWSHLKLQFFVYLYCLLLSWCC